MDARVILGDREVVVEAGQAAEFDTSIPHGVAALGGEPVEVLSIINRSGEGMHLPGIDRLPIAKAGIRDSSSW